MSEWINLFEYIWSKSLIVIIIPYANEVQNTTVITVLLQFLQMRSLVWP